VAFSTLPQKSQRTHLFLSIQKAIREEEGRVSSTIFSARTFMHRMTPDHGNTNCKRPASNRGRAAGWNNQ